MLTILALMASEEINTHTSQLNRIMLIISRGGEAGFRRLPPSRPGGSCEVEVLVDGFETHSHKKLSKIYFPLIILYAFF